MESRQDDDETQSTTKTPTDRFGEEEIENFESNIGVGNVTSKEYTFGDSDDNNQEVSSTISKSKLKEVDECDQQPHNSTTEASTRAGVILGVISTEEQALSEAVNSSDIDEINAKNAGQEAVNKVNLETDDIDENTSSKTEDGFLALETDSRSLRSFAKFSSRDSLLTSESVKDFHGELKTFASFENVKELSISEESSRSHSEISEKSLSDSDSRPTESAFKRAEIIEQCRSLLAERKQLRLKNILLQKKLHDYFKKKKAEGTYREGESIIDALGGDQAELHYRRNLLVFEDLLEKDAYEREKLDSESRELLHRKNELLDNAVTQVDSLLKYEEILGQGLIDSHTGKVVSGKVIVLLINRQRQMTKQLTETMLKYIRVRDEVAEKEAAIKVLEDLGEGLHLIDYEQLCVEKRALSDKIEERDNELSRKREKIETSILALSHLHEKAYDSDQLINEKIYRLNELTYMVHESRENRTKAKKRLIHLRSETENLQREAGLLIHHSLLRDFENVLVQTAEIEHEMDQMKKDICKDKKLSVPRLNTSKQSSCETPASSRNIANRTASCPEKEMSTKPSYDKNKEKKHSEQSQKLDESEKSPPKIYKGRASVAKFLPKVN